MDRKVDVKNICSFFEGRYDKGFYEPGRLTCSYELVYIRSGRIRLTANEKSYILNPGDIFLISPGNFISAGDYNSSATVFFLEFSADLKYETFKPFAVFSLGGIVKDYMEKIIFLLNKASERAMELSRIYLELIITILSDYNEKTHENLFRTADTYEKIYTYLNSEFTKKLTLGKIAEDNNISVSSLKSIVQKYTGLGVIGFFNIIKIMRAKELYPDLTQKEISRKLGFSTESYYSRIKRKGEKSV